MNRSASSRPRTAPPIFEEFPYLLIRVSPALFHFSALPVSWGPARCAAAGQRQCDANDLPAAVALKTDLALYLRPGRPPVRSSIVPRSHQICSGRMAVIGPGSLDAELAEREAGFVRWASRRLRWDQALRLDRASFFVEAAPQPPDFEPAPVARSVDELSICRCEEPHGALLHQTGRGPAQVVRLTCRCANNHRCVRCGEPLYHRPLNSSYWAGPEAGVVHVPGYSAFFHRCGTGRPNAEQKAARLADAAASVDSRCAAPLK